MNSNVCVNESTYAGICMTKKKMLEKMHISHQIMVNSLSETPSIC